MSGYVPRMTRLEARRRARHAARRETDRRTDGSAAEGLLAELTRLEELQAAIDREMAFRLADFDDGEDFERLPTPMPIADKIAGKPKRVAKGNVEKRAKTASRLPDQPVVPISKSVTRDGIICLIDGEKRKMLHRHLKTRYGMTPQQYRDHFGLPGDYPMTAPGYSASQSKAVSSAIAEGRVPGRSSRQKA